MQLSENVVNFLKANGIDLNSSESQRATKLQRFVDDELLEDSEDFKAIYSEALRSGSRYPDNWAKDQINAILVKQMAEAIENHQERTTGFKMTQDHSLLNGTHFIAEIKVDYHKLVEFFGNPSEGDGHKMDAEWMILFDDDTVATIYNWKNGHNYLGIDGYAVEDIDLWHIGGHDQQAAENVKKVLNIN